MDPLIHVQSISYSYPVNEEAENDGTSGEDHYVPVKAVKALDQIDLQAERGQFICILGSNGSGKSTLARHLNALLVPDEGTVWVGGMNTQQEENLWDIRSQVGMVFQNPDNQMVASQVDEEVAFGLENIGIPSEQIQKEVEAALKAAEMTGFEKDNPYYLSGGQKQRIAIAGILAMKPACIVLDESTSMLDPRGRQEIMNTVLRLHKEQNITVICITHFMEEALAADQVFVMDKGRVLCQGSPEYIFAQTRMLEAAGLQLPVVCQLTQRLRELGMDIPAQVITSEAFINFIKQSYADQT